MDNCKRDWRMANAISSIWTIIEPKICTALPLINNYDIKYILFLCCKTIKV
jgi:hypothetical protein